MIVSGFRSSMLRAAARKGKKKRLGFCIRAFESEAAQTITFPGRGITVC